MFKVDVMRSFITLADANPANRLKFLYGCPQALSCQTNVKGLLHSVSLSSRTVVIQM